MAPAAIGNHPFRAQKEQEATQGGFTVGKLFGIESLVGLLVRSLVIQPSLSNRSNDNPIAGQVDGVAIALIDGRHSTAGIGPVERVARPFAFDGHAVPLMAVEVA